MTCQCECCRKWIAVVTIIRESLNSSMHPNQSRLDEFHDN